MMNNFSLSEQEKAEIDQSLPPEQALLRETYPRLVYNAVSAREWPSLNQEDLGANALFEIFCREDTSSLTNFDGYGWEPDIIIQGNELKHYNAATVSSDGNIIECYVQGMQAYIAVEGHVLLNRLGDISLPDVLIDPYQLLLAITSLRHLQFDT